MKFKSLKREFLAAFPVIGPHVGIEAELMLAKKKDITWSPVFDGDTNFGDDRILKMHLDRKRMDQAVEEGALIAMDVEYMHPQTPGERHILRHYAQPECEDILKRVVACYKYDRDPENHPESYLEKDIGHYLGYKKRDILFFNNVVNNQAIPRSVASAIVGMNAACQRARREKLLLEAGYDIQEWRDNLPKLECSK